MVASLTRTPTEGGTYSSFLSSAFAGDPGLSTSIASSFLSSAALASAAFTSPPLPGPSTPTTVPSSPDPMTTTSSPARAHPDARPAPPSDPTPPTPMARQSSADFASLPVSTSLDSDASTSSTFRPFSALSPETFSAIFPSSSMIRPWTLRTSSFSAAPSSACISKWRLRCPRTAAAAPSIRSLSVWAFPSSSLVRSTVLRKVTRSVSISDGQASHRLSLDRVLAGVLSWGRGGL